MQLNNHKPRLLADNCAVHLFRTSKLCRCLMSQAPATGGNPTLGIGAARLRQLS